MVLRMYSEIQKYYIKSYRYVYFLIWIYVLHICSLFVSTNVKSFKYLNTIKTLTKHYAGQ